MCIHVRSQEIKPHQTYYPQRPIHQHIWNQMTDEQRAKRFNEAKTYEKALLSVKQNREEDESERAAFQRLLPSVHRSRILRWKKAYAEEGFEGLIDWRFPSIPRIPAEIHTAICTLRQANPQISVDDIIEHLNKHYQYNISATAIRKILKANGLERPKGPVPGSPVSFEKPLSTPGAILLEVMDVKYRITDTLSEGVSAVRDECLRQAPAEKPVDTSGRDECGRFLPSYNERYRKKTDDVIGPGFYSIDEKRKDKDFHRLHLNTMSHEVIQRKLIALINKPLITAEGWDHLRAPAGDKLREICGFPYMPATLELFCRELMYLGAASTLWEYHARLWIEQLSSTNERWARDIFFIDGTSKPSFTELYSESTRVCNLGKVMPGVDVVSFHLGNGMPFWMTTHSGRMPLVQQTPYMLEKIDKLIDDEHVGRIIVIDAEGNSLPFLQGLEQGPRRRAWVTRLKSSWISNKRITNQSKYKTYCNGDRIRMGQVEFTDNQGEPFQMRVIEVERVKTGKITYLGASMLFDEQEWSVHRIANLYFDRWPKQEANFRAVNQTTRFKHIHGYGKQLVDNVSVLTEYDTSANKLAKQESNLEKIREKQNDLQQNLHDNEKTLRKHLRRKQTIKRNIESEVNLRQTVTSKIKSLVAEQKKLDHHIEKKQRIIERQQRQLIQHEEKINKTRKKTDELKQHIEELERNKKIFVHDVEQDSLFNLFNAVFVMLVQLIIKHLFSNVGMDTMTFIKRVAHLPARSQKRSHYQIVTFEYNRRDPEIMNILASQCEHINALKLKTRQGKFLFLKVDPPPSDD